MCNAHNHPPDCTCGWGGDGHAGTSYGGNSGLGQTYYSDGGTRVWRERDFTSPSRCPECGKDVFFIRHNGGSVWVDPPLGWPWPKHPCFDKPNEPTRSFSVWSAKSSGLTNPKLGIIKRIERDSKDEEPWIVIKLPDLSRVSLKLRWMPPDSSLLGALVIFSKEDSLLLHEEYAEIPFHSFSDRMGWYKCPRCSAFVQRDTGHEEFCRRHWKPGRVKPINLHKTKSPAPISPLVRIPSKLEERINSAMDKVARESWETAMSWPTVTERFTVAKREALQLIKMLSPHLRRQVEHRFSSAKWQPLLDRKPK